jgi:hypothetical protein
MVLTSNEIELRNEIKKELKALKRDFKVIWEQMNDAFQKLDKMRPDEFVVKSDFGLLQKLLVETKASIDKVVHTLYK